LVKRANIITRLLFSSMLLCLCNPVVWAEEASASKTASSSFSLWSDSLQGLSHFQVWLGHYVGAFGRKLDGLLANEASLDEANGSRLVVRLPYTVHANTEQGFTPSVDANIDLPQLNQKWKLFVSSLNQEEKQPVLSSSETATGKGIAQIGVQVQLKKTMNLIDLLDFGFNAKGLALPAVYTRYKSIFYQDLTSVWRRRWYGKVFWESDLGAGVQLALRHDRTFAAEQLLFRSETQANWWDKGQYWDIYHDFLLYHKINDWKSAVYFMGWNWQTVPKGLHLTRFSLGNKLRLRLYQKWLYFEIKPLVTFQDTTHFQEADPSLTLQLEMQFYEE